MTKSKEDAVSPVIGVILMVAVTVILAAVIAAFVFGMGSGVQKTKIVAATAQNIGGEIVVTYQGGADDSSLDRTSTTALVATFTQADGTPITATTVFATPWAVGSTASAPHTPTTAAGLVVKDHVTVTATFNDGTTQVILDTQV